MATFPLSWRWTDRRWNELPAEALRQIKPFSRPKAKELWRIAGRYVLSNGPRVNLFECSPWVDAAADVPGAEQRIRGWLLSRFSGVDQEVIVSWEQATAVLTSWGVFCDYWDDFCYPAADDVTVFPPSMG